MVALSVKITSQSGWRVSLKGTDLSSRTSGAAFFRRRQGREKIVETSVRSDFSYQDCLLKALSNDRSGADAACSATRKSCLFLGRHARQRRSLVSSSGAMLSNAEVLFLPRALIESKTFYRPQHVGFIERNIFSRPIT